MSTALKITFSFPNAQKLIAAAAATLDNGILTVKCSWKRTWWDLPLLSWTIFFFFSETPWKIKERKNSSRHAGKYLVLCCSQSWKLGNIFWSVLNYRPFDYARHLALMPLAFNADSMTNNAQSWEGHSWVHGWVQHKIFKVLGMVKLPLTSA